MNIGFYALSQSVIEHLPKGRTYEYGHLVLDSIRMSRQPRAVPFTDYWLDIGRPEDYQLANQEFPKSKQRLDFWLTAQQPRGCVKTPNAAYFWR